MAISDIIGKPLTGMLDVDDAIKSGFDIAYKQDQIRYQRALIDKQKNDVRLAFIDKAADLIPKLKDFKKPGEKKFYLQFIKSYLKEAQIPFDDSMEQLLQVDESASTSISDYADLLQKAYPGTENTSKRNVMLAEKIQEAGQDPSKFTYYFQAESSILNADLETKKKKAEAELKLGEDLTKALNDASATPQFRARLQAYNPQDKLTLANELKTSKEKLKYLREKAFENKDAFLDEAELKDTISTLNLVEQAMLDPAKVSSARQLLDGLENSFISSRIAAIGMEQDKAAKKERLQAGIDLSKAETDIIKKYSKEGPYKDFAATVRTASKVINILNSPVAGTKLGLDAVGTLLSKYLDPDTGVKESEVLRVARAARLGNDADLKSRIKTWARAILYGDTLTPEAQNLIAQLIKIELDGIAPQAEEMLSGIEKDAAMIPGADAEKLKTQILGGYERVKEKVNLMEKIPEDMYSGGKNRSSLAQFWKMFMGSSGKAPEAKAQKQGLEPVFVGPGSSPSPSPSGAAQKPSASSVLQKLFPGVAAPKQESKKEVTPVPSRSELDEMSKEEIFKLWSKKQSEKTDR